MVYLTIKNAASSNGGVMPVTGQHSGAPSYWLAYFTVPSCDGAVARVLELGGEVLVRPLDIGTGRISVVRDPQGAVFALFEGEAED